MQLTRSTTRKSIELAIETFDRYQVKLPPFAFWTVEDWANKGPEVDEIRDCMLGWDVTDFGSSDFEHIGRTLFTVRNGNLQKPGYAKTYAEKLLFDPEGQRAPAHFHRTKMEDIINRGGGNVLVQFTAADPDGRPSSRNLLVKVDGQAVDVKPGGIVRLEPGQSVCIPPYTIHQFWGEEGTGLTVSGEVSSVCDDVADNFFLQPAARFPSLKEDEPRRYYLCHEYPRAQK